MIAIVTKTKGLGKIIAYSTTMQTRNGPCCNRIYHISHGARGSDIMHHALMGDMVLCHSKSNNVCALIESHTNETVIRIKQVSQ